MSLKMFVMFLTIFLVGICFIGIFKRLSLKYNILFIKGIPHIGGLSIGLSFLVGFLFFPEFFKEVKSIILPSLVIFFFGIIDDKKELSILVKFLAQIIAATVLILLGISTHIVYVGPVLNVIITFLWVIGITNAFNHLDILDGVAGSSALISMVCFFFLSWISGDAKIMFLSLALAGAIAGFLIYNRPPAKVYLGNCGSHFLGFILAAIALVISYADLEKNTALLSPLLILGLPIFDTVFLISMRLKNGKSIVQKSNDHLAMRFLKIFNSKEKVFLCMAFIALFYAFCGIMLAQSLPSTGLVIILFTGIISLFIALRMARVNP